jgi:hypothetical protein
LDLERFGDVAARERIGHERGHAELGKGDGHEGSDFLARRVRALTSVRGLVVHDRQAEPIPSANPPAETTHRRSTTLPGCDRTLTRW